METVEYRLLFCLGEDGGGRAVRGCNVAIAHHTSYTSQYKLYCDVYYRFRTKIIGRKKRPNFQKYPEKVEH